MNKSKHIWLLGTTVTLAIIIVPIFLFVPDRTPPRDDPQEHLPPVMEHTSHADLMPGPYETGEDVTRACLDCHPESGEQMLQTTHWRWEHDPVYSPEHDREIALGKKDAINNFCIGIEGNWPACTACHTGYGWEDPSFDFSDEEAIDCLVCHDQSGTYVKTKGGYPAEGVDLAAVAQSVASPTRENCGSCHFKGGGGNAVKHGDLDESLYFPTERIDVHMGKFDFQCITCHQTTDHNIKGRAPSVSLAAVNTDNQVACSDCHNDTPHDDQRLNQHTSAVACQTCHIPTMAKKTATKVTWDWSQAGQDDREEDTHEYLKIKGEFAYKKDLPPEYYWYNGTTTRYIKGDIIDPTQVTPINDPKGSIDDPDAKIWPFKVHRGKQVYDAEYNYFMIPNTAGEGGYWTEFNWQQALELGSETSGLPFSGSYDFAETEMYWPTTHMVSPAEDALQCVDCHSESEGRMDWRALGYNGDPVHYGGRRFLSAISQTTPNEDN
jgi:octaheme c-type cytochrome (tetrathionate reductase family)